jgi:ligand-binding sensor domain-containing protein/class 3 adenylate cyclase
LKNKLKCLIPILLLAACKGDHTSDQTPPELYPQPKTVEVNIGEGYTINTVTGDSIEPIINSQGDAVKTGVPIPVIGKLISLDSAAQPKSHPVPPPNQLTKKAAYPSVHLIPKELTRIPVNKDSLTKVLLEEIAKNDTTHYLVNSTGDTVKTGVPTPALGKFAHTSHPEPTPALPLKIKAIATSNLQYLDVDQGMASSYVYSITEDKSGNLWFGTGGGGVSRYDGTSFTHFTTNEGLSNNTVWAITTDKSGNLWFGTNGGGVSRYDGTSFTHFTTKEGLSNNNVLSITEDKSGNLWFGTNGGGVSRYDGTSFTHFTTNEGLSNNTVLSITEDKSGNLWFGTEGGGVSRYDGTSFTHFTTNEGLSNNNVLSITEDKSGYLWFGTNGGGVSRYDGTSFTHFTTNEGLSNNTVLSITEDKSGNLWFGTEGGGVSRYDGTSFTHFTTNEGLSNNTVWSITADKSGNLWFGTTGGGVSRYDGTSSTHFTTNEGLSNNTVLSITEDKSGNLWFGTNGGGVSRYDGTSFTHFTTNEGLSNNTVLSITEDKSGNLWFGTWGGGVSRYDGTSFTHFTTNEGLSNNTVLSITEDKSGNLWFGTRGGGVNRYDGTSFTHFTTNEGLSNNNVWSITEDKSGNLWLGTTGGGVSCYDGTSFTHFTTKEGLSNNTVLSITEDKSGNLWFGTRGGGVSRYDGTSFTHFTTNEGLSNNTVWSITADKSGNLWCSTESGITNFVQGVGDSSNTKHSEDNQHLTLLRYMKNDGLKGMDFYANSVCLDSKNRIWWGSGKSLTMLDLNNYAQAQKPPVVYLNQLDINGQFIDYKNLSDSSKGEITFKSVRTYENYPLDLELYYHQNHLTFHFSAIDWAAPHKIQYSYVMKGLSTQWSKSTAETKADYRNLSHGTYTFKLRTIGESGIWSEAFEYTFTIKPPWWHSWWARMLYALLTIFIIWYIVRWRTASLKQRQKELETEVDNATTEIRKQKDVIEKEKVEVEKQRDEVSKEKERSDNLLLNILPAEVAKELKEKGAADAQLIEHVTVIFTDFKGFTSMSEQLSPKELVADLHACFSEFDRICEQHGIEKIKTIGDAYMAAGGLPTPNQTHPTDVVKAALEMAEVVEKGKADKVADNLPFFEVRIGVHTGPVVAGIVGVKKFQYDIWGDTVNTASRMESSGEIGKVNISQATYELLKGDSEFYFESRGKIEAKGKGEIEMYFVSIA